MGWDGMGWDGMGRRWEREGLNSIGYIRIQDKGTDTSHTCTCTKPFHSRKYTHKNMDTSMYM